MADFLEEKKREISERLEELRPLVDEFHKLEAAQRALEGVGDGQAASSSSDGPGRRRGRPKGSGGGTGGGRRKGSGARAAQARELVTENPGITIPEMAQKMGIQQNYLYRVLPDLEQSGEVRKDGRGWFPVEAA